MTALSKSALKALWKAYFQPTSADFSNLIDSWADYSPFIASFTAAVSGGSTGIVKAVSPTTAQFLPSGAFGESMLAATTTAAAQSLMNITYPVSVANGGTGVASLSANHVVLGNGTSAVQLVAPGASGNVLTSNGTTWQSSAVAGIPSGSVMDYAGSTAPSGWLLCAGQAVSRSTYADLFTTISTTYGAGDGSTTFNLPDLRGRVAVGKDDMNGTAANRITSGGSGITGTTLGNAGGTQTHTLTTTEMPAHTHSIDGGGCFAGNGGNGFSGSSGATGSTGGGGAHQNVQPSMILNKIIKT